MKKAVKIFLALLFFSPFLYGQSLSGIKICIDPGHGGHDSANDRFIPQTGFWESDGNWDKALHIKQILQSMGATVIVTRQGNNDADDLALSQRAAIANNNSVDFMHSIHSNGHLGTANYSLLLFRGSDTEPVFTAAKTMGSIMVQKIFEANRTTAAYNRGDWSFYGVKDYLGVLRPLNMPGVLSEGSFHDYIPESWRLMNSYYRRHETWGMTRAYLQFFNAGETPYGAIAGIVRDPLQNVSYYYIPSTNDQKKPVNLIKITVMPDSIVYIGDDKNNGFFLFDSLPPGSYKIYYEGENYALDSSTVIVIANRTTFADKNLSEAPNYNPPIVSSHTPDSGAVDVGLLGGFSIKFDIRMNTQSVQSALSISPSVSGSFSWSNNDKDMAFVPASGFAPGTEYTITISNAAKSYYNVNLAKPFSFKFTTKAKLNLLSYYPKDNEEGISTTVSCRIQFDGPINSNSIGGNVTFQTEAGVNVPVSVDLNAYAQGKIVFEPQNPLSANTLYKITLKPGIKDTENLMFGETKEILFQTDNRIYISGIILDSFEDIGQWKDPDWSGSTSGTDPDLTTFSIVSDKKLSGMKSGKINYVFTGANGLCRTFNGTKPSVGSNPASRIGLWVYGDLSYNLLEYWFYYSATNNAIVSVDTIDWTGWKLMDIPLSSIGGSGERLFHSVVVKQLPEGKKTGAIYIDDMQYDILLPVAENIYYEPEEFSLSQNYPNPFNPTTRIRFSIPAVETGLIPSVQIKVYDILGKEIAILVNEEKAPGTYEVEFDASNLTSGVYFYRMTAGSYNAVKKLILAK